MPDSPPRRKRLIIIFIIIGDRVNSLLDKDVGTPEEICFAYLCRAWAMFETAEGDWTAPYNNLYAFIDGIGDALDETPTADVETYLGDFETLLELADL